MRAEALIRLCRVAPECSALDFEERIKCERLSRLSGAKVCYFNGGSPSLFIPKSNSNRVG